MKTKYLIIAGVLQLIWGLVPTASKVILDEIPVELYISIRWAISGLVFLIYLFLTKQWRPLHIKNYLGISILGILGYGLASLGTLYGLKVGGVVNFSLVASMGPIITSIVSIVILKERPTKLFYLALGLSCVGLILLALGKYQVSSISVTMLSLGLILTAFVLEALVFVYSKKFRHLVSAIQYLAISQLSAAALMWILQISFFRQTSSISNLSGQGILATVFVSIVACVFCYAILYWLLNHIDGHRLALFEGFHALSAIVFSLVIFSEPFAPTMIAGGGLVLVGLVLGNWPEKTE